MDALDSNKTEEVFQQDQACASVSKKTEELETGIISNPLDHSNDKGEDESKCQDTLREGSSKVKDLDESKNFSLVEKPFSGTEEAKRADVTAEAVGIVNVVSCHGNEIITSDNDNLVTVIQGNFFFNVIVSKIAKFFRSQIFTTKKLGQSQSTYLSSVFIPCS